MKLTMLALSLHLFVTTLIMLRSRIFTISEEQNFNLQTFDDFQLLPSEKGWNSGSLVIVTYSALLAFIFVIDSFIFPFRKELLSYVVTAIRNKGKMKAEVNKLSNQSPDSQGESNNYLKEILFDYLEKVYDQTKEDTLLFFNYASTVKRHQK